MVLDVRHLLRILRRSPASALAAVLTLSLTLGAGASIFAIVDAIVLTPPAVKDPSTLVAIGETPIDADDAAPRGVPYARLDAWRERAAAMATFEAFDPTTFILTELGAAERVRGSYVTTGLLALLGVTPVRGRDFTAEDLGQDVAIVSDGFWRGKLAADPDAVGRRIVLGGRPHTIIGILPERFFFGLNTAEIWRPFRTTPARAVQAGTVVQVIARLTRTAPPSQLSAVLTEASRTSSPPLRAVVRTVAEAISGDARRTLGLLAGAAGLALLIAFANLAGLLTVRSIDRRRELAVRSALGATRVQVARNLILEAQLIVALGTLGGILLAMWLTPALARLAVERFGDAANREIAVSWRVIAGVAVVASLCAWACAALPAFMSARRSVVDVLRRGLTPHPGDLSLRRVFVVGEVALAFVLLVSVTVLGRSLLSMLNTNPGFDARGVIVMNVALPSTVYDSADRVVAFYATLQDAVQGRLGAGSTAIIDELPLTHDRGRRVVSSRQGGPGPEAVVRSASPGYFDVMRIPVIAGRPFESGDNATAPPRVVVSEALAQSLFPSRPAVGRQVWFTGVAQPLEIVGVAGDVKHRSLDDDSRPTVYLAFDQAPSTGSIVVVRSSRPAADVVAAAREEVARLDRNLPVYGVRPMIDVVANSAGVPLRRVLTATFGGFALLAIVLGGIGLVGVVAHDVACRRSEIALRIALGANPRRILGATLGQGAWLIAAGLSAGVVLSFWATRALGAVMIVPNRNAALSVAASAIVLAVAGACAVLPAASRASRTDPIEALRGE